MFHGGASYHLDLLTFSEFYVFYLASLEQLFHFCYTIALVPNYSFYL